MSSGALGVTLGSPCLAEGAWETWELPWSTPDPAPLPGEGIRVFHGGLVNPAPPPGEGIRVFPGGRRKPRRKVTNLLAAAYNLKGLQKLT